MKTPVPLTRRVLLRAAVYLPLLGLIATAVLLWYGFVLLQHGFSGGSESTSAPRDSFPLGVDPLTKQITEQPEVALFAAEILAARPEYERGSNTWLRIKRRLAQSASLQQLAGAESRMLVIWPGERREEVEASFGGILRWTPEERTHFSDSLASYLDLDVAEGYYYPGTYVVSKDATPEEVAALVYSRFAIEILDRYPGSIERVVPLHDAITIASLLEREAYTFEDMRQIAGVVWNRLFIDMPLQLDATLQYVRGSTDPQAWWPVPVPSDKYRVSPYNTYQNAGLPPGPIASPDIAAIVAALNPVASDCLFYFHDSNGDLYCSATYEEHLTGLELSFGHGR